MTVHISILRICVLVTVLLSSAACAGWKWDAVPH
jgi:hypothetical protein